MLKVEFAPVNRSRRLSTMDKRWKLVDFCVYLTAICLVVSTLSHFTVLHTQAEGDTQREKHGCICHNVRSVIRGRYRPGYEHNFTRPTSIQQLPCDVQLSFTCSDTVAKKYPLSDWKGYCLYNSCRGRRYVEFWHADLNSISSNKYERYYGPRRRPLSYLLYYVAMVSPDCV